MAPTLEGQWRRVQAKVSLQASSWKAEWITYDFLLGAAAGATVDCFYIWTTTLIQVNMKCLSTISHRSHHS